jgi:eukaryotic-like serine/threonine-protein kinase
MTLEAGAKLGPYEIIAPIGQGGMGEVYRARDPRVGRDVAIKISAEQFNERFEREIRAVASLNHSNICILHDVGPNYLVMELVDGPTLEDRIKQGPIPLEESLEIAQQIADALEAAHEKGIVHRDLKPANIKIKPDGTVKVLDFGLAKVGGTPVVNSDNSPTLSVAQTAAGVILGTAAYMSPEQAKGKTVDKRADIWAFGVVLYEMLTGKQLFQGDTVSDILASVIKEHPDWDKVPTKVQRLLRSCLQKDQKRRLADISDAKLLLEDAPGSTPASKQATYVLGALAAVFFVASVVLLLRSQFASTPALPEVRFEIFPPEGGSFTGSVDYGTTAFPWPQISPDGRVIAFVATVDSKQMLWVRPLDSPVAHIIPGTEDASRPFWSPDGNYLGFVVQKLSNQGSILKIVQLSGGPPQILCTLPKSNTDSSWSPRGVILAGQNSGPLMRVSTAGGEPTAAVDPDASRTDLAHRFPYFLPDGHHFLFLVQRANTNTAVYIGDLDSKNLIELPGIHSQTKYSLTGHILFVRDLILMAQPFDADRLKFTGDAFPIRGVEQITSNPWGGAAAFSVSNTGGIAYRSTGSRLANTQLVWFDRNGNPLGVATPPEDYQNPELSPDGRYVAFNRGTHQGIWVLDLQKGTTSRFTANTFSDGRPLWMPPGGRMIAFFSNRDNSRGIYQRAFGFAGGGESLLLKTGASDFGRMRLSDWSRDGAYLLFSASSAGMTSPVLWTLQLSGEKKPFRVLDSNFDESGTFRISPDGRWLAMSSSETGRSEIYVQSFMKPGERWPVSRSGGYAPRWRRDGKELFFVERDGALMAATVQPQGSGLEIGIPKPLFKANFFLGGVTQPVIELFEQYDVTGDGRFLVNAKTEQQAAVPISVILNWAAGLKK